MHYLDALKRRYSVKKFNPDKTVPEDIILNILESGKLAASSMGLQPYQMLVAASAETKQKLIPAFYNPSQISTCSHLIILVSKKNIAPEYLDRYFSHISETRNVAQDTLHPFRNNINTFLSEKQAEEIVGWSEKQSYIVLANLMFSAALEEVDSCPMEGFKPNVMEEILGIDTEQEKVAVVLALGYRAEDDAFQSLKKVRKPDEKLFKFI